MGQNNEKEQRELNSCSKYLNPDNSGSTFSRLSFAKLRSSGRINRRYYSSIWIKFFLRKERTNFTALDESKNGEPCQSQIDPRALPSWFSELRREYNFSKKLCEALDQFWLNGSRNCSLCFFFFFWDVYLRSILWWIWIMMHRKIKKFAAKILKFCLYTSVDTCHTRRAYITNFCRVRACTDVESVMRTLKNHETSSDVSCAPFIGL